MSKRVGLSAMLVVVAVVGVAAVVAQAGGDPAQPECASRYVAVGDVMPSEKSVHATPTEAAVEFAANMQADGKPIAAGAEVVDISGSESSEVVGDRVFAATVNGETKVVMGLVQMDEGWAVESFISC